MVIAGIDPVGVVAFHHVVVVRPLQAAEVQCGERDAESVLVIADDDVRIVPEFPLDGGALPGLHQDIVDLQILENQRDGPLLGHIQRVEPGEAVGAAEHERAVRQDAGGPFGELVSADAVFLEVVDEPAHGAVELAESVHRGHPDVALAVFLDRADVQAGDPVHRRGDRASLGVPEQAVRRGSRPELPGAVLEETSGAKRGMTGAGRLFFLGHGQFGDFVRERVDAHQHPVEAGDHDPALHRHFQVGDIGRFGIVPNGDVRRFPGGLVVPGQVGAHAAHPDTALPILRDGIDIRYEQIVQHLEAASFIAAPDHPVLFLEEQPQVAAGVAEHLRAAVVAHAGVRNQGRNVHAPEVFPAQVIQPQAVAERGDPEPLLLVQAQGHHCFPGEGRCQELVAVELIPV